MALTACRAALAPLEPALIRRDPAVYRARHATCLRALAALPDADPALLAVVGVAGAGWRLDARSPGGCCAGPLQCAPRHQCPDGEGGRGGEAWAHWTWHPTRPGVVVSRSGLTCDVILDCGARLVAVAAEEGEDERTCGRWSGGPRWREDPARRRRARWMAGEVDRVRREVQRAAEDRPES